MTSDFFFAKTTVTVKVPIINNLAKAAALRINLIIDGAPIARPEVFTTTDRKMIWVRLIHVYSLVSTFGSSI
jgi:hypothetical protein